MVGAPAILIGALRSGFQADAPEDAFSALLYFAFAVGWFCSMVGLYRLRATGHGTFSRVVAALPLITLPLAMMQSVFDLAAFNTRHPLYMVSDLAWPLSMSLTLIVGVTVFFAGQLRGWRRVAPFFCGLGLPVAIILGIIFGEAGMLLSFPLHTALGWLLLGFSVYSAAPKDAAAPAFAH